MGAAIMAVIFWRMEFGSAVNKAGCYRDKYQEKECRLGDHYYCMRH